MQCVLLFRELMAAAQGAVGPSRLLLCALGALVVFARVFLRLPYAVILTAVAAPVALLVWDNPITSLLGAVDPRLVLAASWIVLLVAAAGLRLYYAACGWLSPFGPRGAPLVAAVGLACLSLLFMISASPEYLDSLYPGWAGTWGAGCLGAAGIAVSVSCLRCLRFAIPLLFWGAMVAGLGGYLVYEKRPSDLLRLEQSDLTELLSQFAPQQRKLAAALRLHLED